jgi:putative phosphoesterase
MRIAVIADTHDRFPAGLPEKLRAADEIWHLGDVCDPSTLVEFEQLGPPLRVVLGNNDWHAPWPLELTLEREGIACHLVHIPPRRAPKGCRILLHGHTHVPRDDVDVHGVRWLNPGCISYANRGAPPSFAWLELERGVIRWRFVRL